MDGISHFRSKIQGFAREARHYITRIEELTEKPVKILSVGPTETPLSGHRLDIATTYPMAARLFYLDIHARIL